MVSSHQEISRLATRQPKLLVSLSLCASSRYAAPQLLRQLLVRGHIDRRANEAFKNSAIENRNTNASYTDDIQFPRLHTSKVVRRSTPSSELNFAKSVIIFVAVTRFRINNSERSERNDLASTPEARSSIAAAPLWVGQSEAGAQGKGVGSTGRSSAHGSRENPSAPSLGWLSRSTTRRERRLLACPSRTRDSHPRRIGLV